MASSGTYNFAPSLGDLFVDAFERIQLSPTALEANHLISARRSANLILQRWGNLGVNLWAVELLILPLIAGTPTYTLDARTINLLDCYIRLITLNPTVSVVPSFTTAIGSSVVTINLTNHGLAPGNYVQVLVPVNLGGVFVFGTYTVLGVNTANQFTINAGMTATLTVTASGATPNLATTAGSPSVTVTIGNHNLTVGSKFSIAGTPVSVGGITLSAGSYPVTSVLNSAQFTINVGQTAISNGVASENGGKTIFATQNTVADPIDIMIYPLSRDDYAMVPDKFITARPTSFWFNRTVPPQVTFWQVPDGNGIYEFRAYRMRQIQDASPSMGQTLDAPNRFLEAFTAALTAKLAEKFRPEVFADKLKLAELSWLEAAQEDREKVPLYLVPDFSGYR